MLAAASIGWAAPASADTVRVTVRELPAGLSISATTLRTECRDGGITHIEASRVPLVESSFTVYDVIQLSGGRTLIRPRVITSYGAQFVVEPSPVLVRCSRLAMARDFSTRIDVLGGPAPGTKVLTSRSLQLATYDTGSALVDIDRTPEAKSLSLINAMALPFTALRRGQSSVVTFNNRNSFGREATDDATLTLSRPSSVGGLSFSEHLVTMSVNRAGRACITAGTTTRCAGDAPGTVIHGGVRLDGFRIRSATFGPNLLTDAEARFAFTLQPEFAAGTVRVTAAANDRDLPTYLVDGVVRALDLLPWQSTALDVPVN